eukprot:XP_011612857.1 PREDICTED: uncharacterized protein LOC105417902 [Takifugu rubripes]
MKLCLDDKLGVNLHNYKGALDRIIEKYSKLAKQHGDEAIEVDLSSTTPKTLKRYMSVSEVKLKQMEAQSSTDVSDESSRAHDFTGDSQLDSLHQDDGECDDSNISSTQFSLEEEGEGMIRIDTSQLPQWSVSMVDFQPEDQDKELEISLRSNASLMELYPSMITRLEQAWLRHNISEAADSVLRRYRKWRHQSQKSHLSDTFDVTLRHCRPTDMASESSLDVHLQPPLRAQRRSPGRGRSPQRKTQQWPVVVMDFSDNSGPFEPQNCSPDETFDVPEQGELSCSYSVSPPRLYPTAKKLSLPHPDRTYAYSSPARHSPFQTRKPSSPQSVTRSPKVCLPQVKSPAAQRLLFPQEAPLDQAQPLLPLSATATGHNRLRHQRSFDASLLLDNTYTAKDLDRDFIKLYHRLVCQSKSPFFKRFPCRVCAKNPDASKNRSSSSLAALALSPHRSLLRKRACEESLDSSPGKRSRDQSYTSSPGSKRHSIEMLRRRLSLAEPAQLRDGVCNSLTKKSFLPRITSVPERTRMSREPGVGGDH